MVGEVNNGDSIEIQHRGTTNGVLNIDMTRLDLRDPASANSGGIGLLNASNLETLDVLVENSSLSDFTAPAGATPIAAVTVTHPADKTLGTAVIDLGGGSLGSRGRNRFVKNAGLDVSVSNANAGIAPIRVDAAGNYWGGGPPVMAPAAPGAPKPIEGGPADVAISGNVTLTPPTHLTSDPAR